MGYFKSNYFYLINKNSHLNIKNLVITYLLIKKQLLDYSIKMLKLLC